MSYVTKRALKESLMRMTLKKPVNKITISDITESCGINRMTFYYHFQDIYDLVEWSIVDGVAIALEDKKTYDTWQQGFRQVLQFFLDYKDVVCSVYNSVNLENIQNYLYSVTNELLLGVINELSEGMNIKPEEKQAIADFYKFAFVGKLTEWFRKGMREDPDLIVEQVSTIAYGSMKEIIKRFQKS